MPNRASILLCEDEKLLRTTLAELMSKWSWVDSIDTAANGEEALLMLEKNKYELLLLDVNMPIRNGISVAQVVLKTKPNIRIVMLTNHDGDALILTLYRLGIHGFLLKDTEPAQLDLALQTVMSGVNYFAPSVLRVINANPQKTAQLPDINVAPRHKQVLELLVKGRSPKEIAEKLSMSVNTVNSYKSDMMELTRTQTTIELIAYVQKNGIL